MPGRIARLPTNPKAVIDAPRRKHHSFLCCPQGFRCDVPSSRRFRDESIALVQRCRASYGQDIYRGRIKVRSSFLYRVSCSTNLSKYKSSPLLIVVSKASVGGSSCRRKPWSSSSSLHLSRSSFTVGVIRSVAVAHALESTIYFAHLVSCRSRPEVNRACTIFLFVILMQSSRRKSLTP